VGLKHWLLLDLNTRHCHESGNPNFEPTQLRKVWFPAFAGITGQLRLHPLHFFSSIAGQSIEFNQEADYCASKIQLQFERSKQTATAIFQ
jgi:hypothetical protein